MAPAGGRRAEAGDPVRHLRLDARDAAVLRVITMVGMGIQGYAIWAGLTRSLIWPVMWPSGIVLFPIVLLIYYIGFCLQNATLASELIRKTQLESEQLAAQQIQKTLQPTTIGQLPGYEVDAFYKPLRAVGGDYFDVIDLPGNRTLFAVADVAGKGIAAALLAANIQALVRSLSSVGAGRAGAGVADQPASVPVHAGQPFRHRGVHRARPGVRRAGLRQCRPQSADRLGRGAGRAFSNRPARRWGGSTT